MAASDNNTPQQRTGFRLSQYIFGLQTIPLLASSAYTLIWPSAASRLLNSSLQGNSNGTIQAMSITSLSLGTYQLIATYQNNIPIMLATVPGRLLAGYVFWQSGEEWASVAPFEACMGLVIAAAAYWDYWRTSRRGVVEDGKKR